MVNATGWLTPDQIAAISPDERMRWALTGGGCTAIVSPEGRHLASPLTHGEGILLADMDMALVIERKRMMNSVGHDARPELLSLNHDDRPTPTVVAPSHIARSRHHERQPAADEPCLRRDAAALRAGTGDDGGGIQGAINRHIAANGIAAPKGSA